MIRRLVAVAMFVLTLHAGAACAATAEGGRIAGFTVPVEALRSNLLADPPAVRLMVYVHRATTRVPTDVTPRSISFTASSGAWTTSTRLKPNRAPRAWELTALLDVAITKGAAREMIVVVPEARNAYFGSFYANSVLTGNWEDAIVREVVPWIDSRFRTIAAPESAALPATPWAATARSCWL